MLYLFFKCNKHNKKPKVTSFVLGTLFKYCNPLSVMLLQPSRLIE